MTRPWATASPGARVSSTRSAIGPVGHDRDGPPRRLDGDGPLGHLRLGDRRGAKGQQESRRGTSESTEESRAQVSQKSSSDKGVYAISRLFGRATFIARRHAQHVAQERQRTGDTKDGGPRLSRGEG